jgi:hypothetical protein
MQFEPEEKTKIRSDIKQSSGKKPASRWRNKYRFEAEIEWADCIDYIGIKWGDIHPSREVAEQYAADFLACCADTSGGDDDCSDVVFYLGAFPIDGE